MSGHRNRNEGEEKTLSRFKVNLQNGTPLGKKSPGDGFLRLATGKCPGREVGREKANERVKSADFYG